MIESFIIAHLNREINELKRLKYDYENNYLTEKIKSDQIEWLNKLIELREFEVKEYIKLG